MPVFKFKTKDEVPAELHDQIKESADKAGFEINLVPNTKLDEFRQNNINVSKERDDLKDFKAKVSPLLGEKSVEDWAKEISELTGIAQKVKDGSLKASDAIEAEVTKRTETMRGTLESQIATKAVEAAAWKAKADAGEMKLRQFQVDNAINALAADPSIGMNPKATADVLSRARAVFEVQADGSLVPKKNGEVIRGENGVDPMTPTEWIKGLRKEADYYFLGSKGGGAGGDSTAGKPQYGGMTETDFNKLPPMERLKIANRAKSS